MTKLFIYLNHPMDTCTCNNTLLLVKLGSLTSLSLPSMLHLPFLFIPPSISRAPCIPNFIEVLEQYVWIRGQRKVIARWDGEETQGLNGDNSIIILTLKRDQITRRDVRSGLPELGQGHL